MTKICSDNLHGFAQHFILIFKNSFHGNWCIPVPVFACFIHASSLKKKASALGIFRTLLSLHDTSFFLQNSLKKKIQIYLCSNVAKCALTYIKLLDSLEFVLYSAVTIDYVHDQNWLNNSQTLIPRHSINYKCYKVNNPPFSSKICVYIWGPLVCFII